jgi:hypothetical protein
VQLLTNRLVKLSVVVARTLPTSLETVWKIEAGPVLKSHERADWYQQALLGHFVLLETTFNEPSCYFPDSLLGSKLLPAPYPTYSEAFINNCTQLPAGQFTEPYALLAALGMPMSMPSLQLAVAPSELVAILEALIRLSTPKGLTAS